MRCRPERCSWRRLGASLRGSRAAETPSLPGWVSEPKRVSTPSSCTMIDIRPLDMGQIYSEAAVAEVEPE